jgi:hypothetical protein
MQASALVCRHNDLAARNAMHFGQGNHHQPALFNGLFRVLLENLARRRQRYTASAAVK